MVRKVIRRRPSRHYRRVKTKSGIKKVLVNKNISKKTPTIVKSERKFFKYISNPDETRREWGGAIDFKKNGRIEQINATPGSAFEVDLDPDYEVQYHTHPAKGISPPTPDDIIALVYNKNQQAEIVFKNGSAFVITKTPKTRALSKLPTKKLFNRLDKAFLLSYGPDMEQKWRKYLESLGFKVKISNKVDTNLPIGVNIIEK